MAIYVGIDVGTGSVHAGLFTEDGALIAIAACSIRIWTAAGEVFEQFWEDIWQAICNAFRQALDKDATSLLTTGSVSAAGRHEEDNGACARGAT